jgi:hypothetical protein
MINTEKTYWDNVSQYFEKVLEKSMRDASIEQLNDYFANHKACRFETFFKFDYRDRESYSISCDISDENVVIRNDDTGEAWMRFANLHGRIFKKTMCRLIDNTPQIFRVVVSDAEMSEALSAKEGRKFQFANYDVSARRTADGVAFEAYCGDIVRLIAKNGKILEVGVDFPERLLFGGAFTVEHIARLLGFTVCVTAAHRRRDYAVYFRPVED